MEFALIEPQGRCEDCYGKSNVQQCARLNCRGSFYMGKYEVTQGEWKKVMDNNPSHFQLTSVVGGNASKIGAMLFDAYPVERGITYRLHGGMKVLVYRFSGLTGKNFLLILRTPEN
jgi:hypothetical protein